MSAIKIFALAEMLNIRNVILLMFISKYIKMSKGFLFHFVQPLCINEDNLLFVNLIGFECDILLVSQVYICTRVVAFALVIKKMAPSCFKPITRV